MKIAICAIVKNENLYLREWVEHHKNLGFDKIILYDNNAIDGEFPQQVIFDYVESGYVDVHNVRGVPFYYTKDSQNHYLQPEIYNNCINDYKNEYEWIAFIDVDEFFEIETNNIHHTFDLMEYDKSEYDAILVSWMSMGDTQLYYEDRPIKERFNEVIQNNVEPNNGMPMGLSSLYVKTILKTSANKGFIESVHCPAYVNPCTSKVGPINMGKYIGVSAFSYTIWEVMYIKHYCIKSFGEYLCRRLGNNQLNRFDEYKQVLGWSDQHQKMYDYMKKYIEQQWK